MLLEKESNGLVKCNGYEKREKSEGFWDTNLGGMEKMVHVFAAKLG